MNEGFVDANGVLIYYMSVGRGSPLMIVHGGPGASSVVSLCKQLQSGRILPTGKRLQLNRTRARLASAACSAEADPLSCPRRIRPSAPSHDG